MSDVIVANRKQAADGTVEGDVKNNGTDEEDDDDAQEGSAARK